MKMRWRVMGSVLVLALAFALVPAVAMAAPTITQGVQGVVKDAATGVPIPFAHMRINVNGGGNVSFAAGYDGTYSRATTVTTDIVLEAWSDTHEMVTVNPDVATDTVTTQDLSLVRDDNFEQPVYRFFNMKGGVHFYTASDAEFINVYKNMSQFKYDGVAYWAAQGADIAPTTEIDGWINHSTVPLHRFFNKRTGVHFYTTDVAEMNRVKNTLSAIYNYEGVAYNVSNDSAWGDPVFRFYNPARNAHFYTRDQGEVFVSTKLSSHYRYEGIGFYTGGWQRVNPLRTLDYDAGVGGTVTGDVSQVVPWGGSGTAVTAVPDTAGGYVFMQWSDGVTTATRTDTNVTSNIAVTAEFSLD